MTQKKLASLDLSLFDQSICSKLKVKFCIYFALVFFFQESISYGQKKQNILPNESIKYLRLSDGKILFEKDSQQTLCPASITKLFTTGYMLDIFGSNHSFFTEFFYTGKIKDSRITQDLIVKGGGDPLFTSEDLWKIISDLRSRGIRGVDGNLIIDQSFFQAPLRDPKLTKNLMKSERSYASPISSLGVNFNTVTISIFPGNTVGEKALVALSPYMLNGIKLINNTTTVSSKQTTKIKVKRIINKENGQIKFEVLGTVSTRESQKKYYRSIPTVKNLPGAYIKAFFAENNIPIKGEVQDGLLPSHAKNLIRYQSKSLVEILKSTNTFSNNYMSDILVNHIGRTYQTNMREGSTESTFTTGIDELKQYMIKTLGIKSKFHINSGSGLTTENRISADQVIALLVHMASNYPLFNHFINTLPQVGHEGSFINRFDAKEYQAWKQGIYAKTGTLLHPITVSALAGYFYHPKHKFIAFAIIQNGRINNTQPQLGKLQKSQDLHLHKIYNSF